jgi:hypothetical protein
MAIALPSHLIVPGGREWRLETPEDGLLASEFQLSTYIRRSKKAGARVCEYPAAFLKR